MMIRVFLEESLELLSGLIPAGGFVSKWHGGELRGMESPPLVRRYRPYIDATCADAPPVVTDIKTGKDAAHPP
jgi:hypothetical protein